MEELERIDAADQRFLAQALLEVRRAEEGLERARGILIWVRRVVGDAYNMGEDDVLCEDGVLLRRQNRIPPTRLDMPVR